MNNTKNLVSKQWLLENLTNPNVKIIDCRFRLDDPHWGYDQYLQSHIENAFYFNLDQDFSSPKQRHGGRHPLPDCISFARKLEEIGVIKHKTMIILYDDSRFAFSGRLWWLLRYLGHDQVALLDGGWPGWLNDDFPVTRDLPLVSSVGEFIPTINSNLVVDIERVKQIQYCADVVLVDSRSGDRHQGKIEPIDPIAGHIPNSVNYFWQNITDQNSNIISLTQQQEYWQPLENYQEIIVYCGSGVTACINLWSLAMVGYTNTKLYVGGWSDWCSYQI